MTEPRVRGMNLLKALDFESCGGVEEMVARMSVLRRREAETWTTEFLSGWKRLGRREWLDLDLDPLSEEDALVKRLSGRKFGVMGLVEFLMQTPLEWKFMFEFHSWFLAAQLDAVMEEYHCAAFVKSAQRMKKSIVEGLSSGPLKNLSTGVKKLLKRMTMSSLIDVMQGLGEEKSVFGVLLGFGRCPPFGCKIRRYDWVNRSREERSWDEERVAEEEYKVSNHISVLGRLWMMGIKEASLWGDIRRALLMLAKVDAPIWIRGYVRRHLSCSKEDWDIFDLPLDTEGSSVLALMRQFDMTRGYTQSSLSFAVDDDLFGTLSGAYSGANESSMQDLLFSFLEESRFLRLIVLCGEYKAKLVRELECRGVKAATLDDAKNLSFSSVVDLMEKSPTTFDPLVVLPVKINAAARIVLREWPNTASASSSD